jgi:hypothetical protein
VFLSAGLALLLAKTVGWVFASFFLLIVNGVCGIGMSLFAFRSVYIFTLAICHLAKRGEIVRYHARQFDLSFAGTSITMRM